MPNWSSNTREVAAILRFTGELPVAILPFLESCQNFSVLAAHLLQLALQLSELVHLPDLAFRTHPVQAGQFVDTAVLAILP